MVVFRKVKARKAKYGFVLHVHLDTLELIVKAKNDMRQWDPQALLELDINMNHNSFKVYTDSDTAAELFEAAFCTDFSQPG